MKLTAKLLKKMIKEEMTEQGQYQDFGSNSDRIKMVNESPSVENINMQNIMLVIDALTQLGYLAVPMAAAAMGVTKVLDKTGKSKEEPNKLQEEMDELNPKAELMKRYKELKAKSEKERLSPAENKEFRHIARVLDPVDYSMVQEEMNPEAIKSYIKAYAKKYDLSPKDSVTIHSYTKKPRPMRWLQYSDFVEGLKKLGVTIDAGYDQWIAKFLMDQFGAEPRMIQENNREENLREKISIYVAEMDENQLAEELEKAKARLIDRALEVEKKGHKGSEMSAEKQAEFKSWASKQSEEALRDYINKHK